MFKIIEQSKDFVVFVDDEMPDWFSPLYLVAMYEDGNKFVICNSTYYAGFDDAYILIKTAHMANDLHWWGESYSNFFNKIINRCSECGFGVILYKDRETASKYCKGE